MKRAAAVAFALYLVAPLLALALMLFAAWVIR